jgi:hypothetical protein
MIHSFAQTTLFWLGKNSTFSFDGMGSWFQPESISSRRVQYRLATRQPQRTKKMAMSERYIGEIGDRAVLIQKSEMQDGS